MEAVSFLVGERIILRPVTRSDLDGPYLRWINCQESDVYTEHAQFPHSHEDLERYLESKLAGRDHIWLAIVEKATGCHIGNIEVSGIDWVHRKGTYSILIGEPSAQGKGYGAEASLLLLRHVFGKLNLNRIELGVHEDNLPARKLYCKLGFVEEGRLRQAFLRNGQYRDIIVMGLLAEEFYRLDASR